MGLKHRTRSPDRSHQRRLGQEIEPDSVSHGLRECRRRMGNCYEKREGECAACRQVRGILVREVEPCLGGCGSADRRPRESVASELRQFNAVARLRPSYSVEASIATSHPWPRGPLPLQRPVLHGHEHVPVGKVPPVWP